MSAVTNLRTLAVKEGYASGNESVITGISTFTYNA